MQRHSRVFDLLLICLVIIACASLTVASSPASFCKCTCFSNSTIIPLDPEKPNSVSTLSSLFHLRSHDATNILNSRAKNYRSLSCNDCNRKFCLDYDLPTCKGAKEEDVFTTCFRTERDSRKDQAIVFIFMIATGSLLTWAILKPWVEKWLEAARERRSYIPISGNAGS